MVLTKWQMLAIVFGGPLLVFLIQGVPLIIHWLVN